MYLYYPSTRRTCLYGDNSFRGKLFFGNIFSHNCIVYLLIEGIRHAVFHKVSIDKLFVYYPTSDQEDSSEIIITVDERAIWLIFQKSKNI